MIGEGFPLLNAYDRADSQVNASRNMLRGLAVTLLDLTERVLAGEVVGVDELVELDSTAELWVELSRQLVAADCHTVSA